MTLAVQMQLSIVLPLIAMLGVLLTGRWPNVREALSLVGAALLFIVVCRLYSAYQQGAEVFLSLGEIVPRLELAFRLEATGLLFALIASFLWIVTTVYAIGYMRGHQEANQTRFCACFALAIAAVMGSAFSDNLFTLFIFYEVLTLSTWPLVVHAGTEEARRGGQVYLGILLSTSIVFF